MIRKYKGPCALHNRFCRNVLRLRHEAKLTQKQLAAKVRRPRAFIADLERGRNVPTLMTVAQVAKALEVPAAELFS